MSPYVSSPAGRSERMPPELMMPTSAPADLRSASASRLPSGDSPEYVRVKDAVVAMPTFVSRFSATRRRYGSSTAATRASATTVSPPKTRGTSFAPFGAVRGSHDSVASYTYEQIIVGMRISLFEIGRAHV